MGDEVGRVIALDRDMGENGRVTYELRGQPNFRIDSEGRILVAQQLDREHQPVHHFIVIASDHGRNPGPNARSVPVVIQVSLS